ncbi:MAG TPA: cytochrome ubiquinol oxidase subunit I, partial [Bellilinea sp.]|nr:cytochrome ubiquinol oxidase subunit I [Bellilinea sp.]
KALSLLAFNKLSGEVKGINELSAAMEAEHGPGNYVPNIFVTYWSFRIMAGLGTLIALIFLVALFRYYKKKLDVPFKWNWIFGLGILIPYLANTTGWLLTEMGRQPWIVYGKLKTVDAVSPSITPGMVLASLIGFTLLYGVLMVVDVSLLNKYAKAGIPEASEEPATESTDEKYWS